MNISVNNRYTLEKELLVTLNGKNTEIKLQVQEEVNRRIEKNILLVTKELVRINKQNVKLCNWRNGYDK